MASTRGPTLNPPPSPHSLPAPSQAQVAQALAEAGSREVDRLLPALAAAESVITARTPADLLEPAIEHYHRALFQAGAAALEGEDPQRVEDVMLAAAPDSPLAEQVFRLAWIALVDHLGRGGDKPVFGGTGSAEAWAFTARSRPPRFLDVDKQVEKVADRFGGPAQVVVVRGPGRSAFLAAVRRALLGRHGALALIAPVLPAACDELGAVVGSLLGRADLDEALSPVVSQLRLGEDFIGALGRAAERSPVALLFDDAHVQSRALLLGAPILLERADSRQMLALFGAPDDRAHDGALREIIEDARERNILVEISLPAVDETWIAANLEARLGPDAPAGWPARILALCPDTTPSERLRVAQAWCDAVIDVMQAERADGATPIERGTALLDDGFDPHAFLPDHRRARQILAVAALEGGSFHANVLAQVVGMDTDQMDDFLCDDEFELDDEIVGTCEHAAPPDRRIWTEIGEAMHPVFEFADPRLPSALRDHIPEVARRQASAALRDVMLQTYGPAQCWQVSDRLWRLDMQAGRDRAVEQLMLGNAHPTRIEAGFARLLPILQAEKPYRLALARLYGAAMEMGGLGMASSRFKEADQAFQAAAAAAERLGRPGPAGEALGRLGEMRLGLSLSKPASKALALASSLLELGGHAHSVPRIELLKAEVHILDGELDEAEAKLEGTVEKLRGRGDAGHVALGLVRHGRLIYERGDIERAEQMLDEAVEMADTIDDPRPQAAARMARAFVAGEQGQLHPAMSWVQQAAERFERAGLPMQVADVAAAGLQRRHGEPEAAAERLKTLATAFKKANAATQWADATHGLARALIDMGQYKEAADQLDETRPIRERGRDRFALVRLFEDLGRAHGGLGDRMAALGAYAQARRICERLGLAGRLGAIDASLALLEAELDGDAAADAPAIRARGTAAIDRLEESWQAQWADEPAPTVH